MRRLARLLTPLLGPEIRVLFCSGYIADVMDQGPLPPHTDFLDKPFTIEELGTRLRLLLDGAAPPGLLVNGLEAPGRLLPDGSDVPGAGAGPGRTGACRGWAVGGQSPELWGVPGVDDG